MTAPEHPFITRDGKAIRADKLKIGESLMPLYRDEKKLGKGVKNLTTNKKKIEKDK